MAQPQWVSIAVGVRQVSGLLQVPSQARACYVLAHGADAALSVSLYGAGLEAARRAETSPATVRAAVTKAFQLVPRLALVAGGKSFGGTYDIAGTGGIAPTRGPWPRIPRILDPEVSLQGCGSGAEALKAAVKDVPGLILLDVMMPNMDGPTTLAHLRESPKTANIPVVFMTARAQARELEHFLSLGAAGVIAKPFDPMKLAAEVRRFSQTGRN